MDFCEIFFKWVLHKVKKCDIVLSILYNYLYNYYIIKKNITRILMKKIDGYKINWKELSQSRPLLFAENCVFEGSEVKI